jgi:hypothetical protein
VGLNTLKLIKEHTNGIGFALSAGDLLDVLHRFYPSPLPEETARKEQSAETKEMQLDKLGAVRAPASQTGSVNFVSPEDAAIYIDGQFVGNIPRTITLPEGIHNLRVTKKDAADWSQRLNVLAGSSVTVVAEFPSRN